MIPMESSIAAALRLAEWRQDPRNAGRFRVVKHPYAGGDYLVFRPWIHGNIGRGASPREALANARAHYPELCGGAS